MAHTKFTALEIIHGYTQSQSNHTAFTQFVLHEDMYSSRGITSCQNSLCRMECIYTCNRCKIFTLEFMCQLTVIRPHFNLEKKNKNAIKWLQCYNNFVSVNSIKISWEMTEIMVKITAEKFSALISRDVCKLSSADIYIY